MSYKPKRLAVDNKVKLNNQVYDTLKWIAQYLLPAGGTLYFALAQIWGLPYGEQVVGTITAVDAFLGVILGISALGYKKTGDGVLNIDRSNADKDKYLFEVESDLEALKHGDRLQIVVKEDNKP